MGRILIVARREFIETVKTRAFLIGTVIMPLVMTVLIFGSQWISQKAGETKLPPRRIAVLDRTGKVYDAFAERLQALNKEQPNQPFTSENVDVSSDRDELLTKVRDREYYGYLIVPPDALSGDGVGELGRGNAQIEPARQIQDALDEAVHAVRLQSNGIDPRVVAPVDAGAMRHIDVATGESASGDELARALTPFVFMFLLYMGTMGISQGLLTSVIEEKNSRVVELLLSAISPVQLMAGKIIGMVSVGAVLMGVWGVLGYVGAHYRGYGNLVPIYQFGYVALYFIPGFLLISALLAGVGSACNTLKEAQSMAFPLSIITIIPMMLWWQISQHPESLLSIGLSFIPPVTPFVMILRLCVDPGTPIWQVVATLVLLWASVLATIWASGKVFRVGVLMYGKPPTLKELAHWIRLA